jgi:hypothetical protein
VTGIVSSSPQTQQPPTSLSRRAFHLALAGLFALGLGLRLLDLTDPPLDFHAWRQLRSASIARAIYYGLSPTVDPTLREKAVSLGRMGPLEPEIAEHLAAYTYLLTGGERLWIPRLYSILAWMIGGVAVCALARGLTSRGGALVALAFYLTLPFGVYASRSFQPDPCMVMWTMLATYALWRWTAARTWGWAATAGLTSGMAILTKVFAVYPVAFTVVAIVLASYGLKRAAADRQTWLVAALMIALPASYYILALPGEASAYVGGWVLPFMKLLATPSFYVRWMTAVDDLVALPFVFAGLLGVLMLPSKARALSLGLWAGYGAIGLSVPSLIISHTYYNLVLVPIVGLSLSPLADLFLSRLPQRPRAWRVAALGIALVGVAYLGWMARNSLVAVDYRQEPRIWQRIGERLPTDGPIIGLTHDYNTRLRYYGWTAVAQWPHASDSQMNVLAGGNCDPNSPNFPAEFAQRTEGYAYFLVTLFGELEEQPALRSMLYGRYPYVEGDGYVIFDLREGR